MTELSPQPRPGTAPAAAPPADHRSERLVLSVTEAAEALGISDDLVYELIARGHLPSLKLGRRKVIPRRAIELVIDEALENFDPSIVLSLLSAADGVPPNGERVRLDRAGVSGRRQGPALHHAG